MKTKSIAATLKAAGEEDGLGLGQFTAYASVFGNVDSYGDIVHKGAFSNTLSEWTDSGAPIPVYWAHQMGTDPLLNLGHVLSATEDEKGLLVTAQLDIANNEKAAYTFQLLKGRRVQQMSFAYDVIEGTERKSDEGDSVGGFDLTNLKLHEVSVVPVGANQETEVIDVKTPRRIVRKALPAADPAAPAPDETPAADSPEALLASALEAFQAIDVLADKAGSAIADFLGVPDPEADEQASYDPLKQLLDLLSLKAGRALSAKNETTLRTALNSLADAHKSINEVLALLTNGEEATASGTGPAKGKELARVTSKEPNHIPTVGACTADLLMLELEGML